MSIAEEPAAEPATAALGIGLAGVTKAFGATRVLKGIDLAIEPGELMVLVGRSGCGKSTLLRAIAGLTRIDAGTITIGGREVQSRPPSERGVAMVFQSYALFPHMTVAENIAFPLMVRKRPKSEQRARAAEVAGTLGLGELLERRPAALSGGQRQRVAIGRALAREADIYLFDEPLSNLDAALRGQMRVELKSLHRRLGRTMVYVTHDQVEAMTLADRIALLDAGEVAQCGTPEKVYLRPENLFVAGFFGSPSMNLVRGTAEQGKFRAGGLVLDARVPPDADTLGLRPEDVLLGEGPLRATVEVVEPVGDRGHVRLRIADQELSATVDGARAFALRPGEELACGLRLEAAHWFDSASGRRCGA